jgi:capsular exopolysaccharide synthesis family protein
MAATDNPKDQQNPENEQRALIEHPIPSALSPWVLPPGSRADFDEDEINLREYWQVILKHKWTVLGFFAVVFIAVFVATLLMTPIYRATTVLQIEREAAKVVQFNDVAPEETMSSSSMDFYQTQYELLKSSSLAQRVVDQIGLDRLRPSNADRDESVVDWLMGNTQKDQLSDLAQGQLDLEKLKLAKLKQAEALLASLTVEPIRKSRLVKVSFDSSDPVLAATVANQFSQNFIAFNLERRFEATAYAKTFLEERIAQVKLKLEEAERAQLEYAREHGIISVDKDGSTTSSLNLGEFNLALAKVQQDRIKAESLYLQLEAAGRGELPQVLENALIQRLKENKAKLEATYQEKSMTFKPGFPAMQELAGQIAEVSQQLDAEKKSVRDSIKANFEAAKAQEALLQQKFQESKSETMSQQSLGVQYSILKREADTNRQLYDGLLQRLKEVSVAGGVGTNNISVVDQAVVPRDKFKPNMGLNLLVAMFLGLLGGVGLAFLFEHLDDTFKSSSDVEKQLNTPVLGIIPSIPELTDGGSAMQIALDNPRSSLAEAFRSLRTALQFSREGGVPKVFAFTSTEMGEGKTTSTLSIAIQLAQSGKRVLLIDADLRNHAMHKQLGLPSHAGLTNYLAGGAEPVEITQNTPVANLFFMSTGPLPPNPADLLMSNKMHQLIEMAQTKFDHIIIDCPPILGLADALILSSMADAVVMVVAAGHTRRASVEVAFKRLVGVRSRILGVVLTKLKHQNQGYGYEYYYAYGGHQQQTAKEQEQLVG